jgi:hypothetical protein
MLRWRRSCRGSADVGQLFVGHPTERKRVSDRTVKYLINGTLCPEKSRADFLARISDNRYLTKRGNSCEKG